MTPPSTTLDRVAPKAPSAPPTTRRTLRRAPRQSPPRRLGRALRSATFWVHLAVGVVTGVVVLVMSATGTALAFQRQILDWSASRHMAAPAPGAERLPLDSLLARARAALPGDAAISSITVAPDPASPVKLGLAARRYAYLDPYTGEVLPASQGLQTFYYEMERWHRAMGMGEGLRGKPGVTITGAANLGFLFLILTGLVLWLPRQMSWRAFRAVLLFEGRAKGRRRDWNWHHVLGVWSAPVLFVLVLSGVFISYQWPGRLLDRALGEPAATEGRGGGRGGGATAAVVPGVSIDAVLAGASAHVAGWQTVQIRMPRSSDAPVSASVATSTWVRPDARTSLSFEAGSAAMTEEPGYASLSTSRKIRGWVRGAHTGEAAGPLGQAVAALACLVGVVLVWTGVALAWRRFLRAVRPRKVYP